MVPRSFRFARSTPTLARVHCPFPIICPISNALPYSFKSKPSSAFLFLPNPVALDLPSRSTTPCQRLTNRLDVIRDLVPVNLALTKKGTWLPASIQAPTTWTRHLEPISRARFAIYRSRVYSVTCRTTALHRRYSQHIIASRLESGCGCGCVKNIARYNVSSTRTLHCVQCCPLRCAAA